MENENLKKQMEELFRLFKKMMEKYPPESMPGIDKAQAEQLKMMLSNYEDMEISFSSDMFGLFDEEMTQKILSKLIKQLKEQLGEADSEDDLKTGTSIKVTEVLDTNTLLVEEINSLII